MKNTDMEITKNKANVWNIDCLGLLKSACKLTNADVVSFQPVTILAMGEPCTLNQGLGDATIGE